MQARKMNQEQKELLMKNMTVADLAPYHEEYRATYPNSDKHFDFLKESFLSCKYSPTTKRGLDNLNFDATTLSERWGPAFQLKDERQRVIEFAQESQPGEIFRDGIIAPYGVHVSGD